MSQTRMRLILHVITGLYDGGAEGALYRLCKFDRMNRHVVVSLMGGGRYVEPLKALDVRVESLGMTKGRVNFSAVMRLRRLICDLRPDIVQTWLYHSDLIGGLVARSARVPQIVWGIRHATLIPGKVKRSTILIARICASLSHLIPTKIICCSRAAKQIHVDLGYDESKFWIIPNGYDLSALAPDPVEREAFRRELGLEDNLPLLGMVSRFDPQKDHTSLLRALAELAGNDVPFKCALVGTGMEQQNAALTALVRELHLTDHVFLLGRRDDIPRVMNGLDIHLLSSVSEAFPNVLAEAMACGTPCVTTDVGDAAMIVGESGWVISSGDPKALAEAVAMALRAREDARGWRDRQAAARTHIREHFDISAIVDNYRTCWSAPQSLGKGELDNLQGLAGM